MKSIIQKRSPGKQPVFLQATNLSVRLKPIIMLTAFVVINSFFISAFSQQGPQLIETGNEQNLGGAIKYDPAVLTIAERNEQYVFACGADDAVWFRVYRDNQWSEWETIGGAIINTPSAYYIQTGKYEALYVFGVGLDRALWMKRYIFSGYTTPENPINSLTNTWSEWISLGGIHQSAPAILGNPGSENQDELSSPWLHLYTTGINGDIQRTTIKDMMLSFTWESITGTNLASKPSLTKNVTGVLTARDQTARLVFRKYNGNTWGDWTSTNLLNNYLLNSDPSVLCDKSGNDFVFNQSVEGKIIFTTNVSSAGAFWRVSEIQIEGPPILQWSLEGEYQVNIFYKALDGSVKMKTASIVFPVRD